MVSVHFFSKFISSWFVFALPLFRSFQALQQRPGSEPLVEHYAKYWIVIGALLTYEYSVEFLISWFPFYWELKLIVLLFIALPQFEGSTYVYDTWLAPVLSRNEAYIDHQIQLAQDNLLVFFQSKVQAVLDRVMGTAGGATGTDSTGANNGPAQPPSAIQNAVRAAMGYLTAHGISIAGRSDGTRPAGSRTPSGTPQSTPNPSASSTSVQSPFANEASRRSGFVPENHVSHPITPEDIYQASASTHNPKGASSPAFPTPQHF